MGDESSLTGRAEELRVICEVLDRREQRGVLIAGQSGVGKTRLAGEAAARMAARGWLVQRLAGTRTGRAVMLGAFARWTEDFRATPLALARQVIDALAASAGGAALIVVVDDAHLLDDLSAFVVHQLVIQDVAAIIATSRTGEAAPDAVTSLWKDGLLKRLELRPLCRSESDALVRSVLKPPVSSDCMARMWRLTSGNTLLLRHLVDQELLSGRLARDESGEWCWQDGPSVSAPLIELVELQIGAVPPEVREVVDLVAVSEPTDQACLRSLVSADAIEAAESRGLITVSATADLVHVGHPLYGEVRLSQCGPLRLRRLRGRIATSIKDSGHPSRVDPLRLGLLWLESDLPPDPGILSRAAAVARSRLDLATAERLARAAVDADAGTGTKLLLASVLFLLERGSEVQDVLDTIRERTQTGFVSVPVLSAANQLWVLGNPDRSWRTIDEALAQGTDLGAAALRTFRAVQLVLAARPTEALETRAAVDDGGLDQLGRLLGLCAETLALGDLGRATEATEKAAEGYLLVIDSPDNSFQGTGLTEMHAQALLFAGYAEDAVTVAGNRYRHCAELPGVAQVMATLVMGMVALGTGDLTTAVRCLAPATAGSSDYGDISGLLYRFRILHTEALARSGDIDGAAAALAATRNGRHPAYKYVESSYRLSAAWVAAASGRLDEARENTYHAAEFARAHDQWAREVVCLQTAVQFGDAGAADRLAELEDLVEGPRAPMAARYASALTRGDSAGLDSASKDFETIGDILAAADAAAQAAVAHRRAGLRGSALTATARAHELAHRCGGATSPALAAAALAFPFTQREREIAALVAQGMSNREIAAATSLSVRTVEGHIYRAITKSGVTSRSGLAPLVRHFDG